ncbi:MAG: phenylacetate--CoA ligase family protein [Terriglobales bacterium]
MCRGLGGRLRRWSLQERRSLEENRCDQWEALQRLLRHAYASSPFYRARFEASGSRPEEIREPADLRRLAPLTRADLREHLDQIVSRRYARAGLLAAASGGTTETPVPLWRDRGAVAEKRGVQESLQAWAGLRPGDPVLMLWGAQSDYAANPSWKWRLYDQRLMRRRWLPTSRLNPEVLEGYRQQLNGLRPRVIVAYPTPLQLFCEYLEGCGRPYWRPRSAVCTAEALLPAARAQIERTLGCRVFEYYASREFGMVAGECERHAGLHLHPLAAYIEQVPLGEEPGAPRELLVTDLLNYGMPLIRYRINDCVAGDAVPEACGCGRGYPLLPPILGRSGDIFRLPDGSLVPGVALNRMPRLAPGIAKIQMIQETLCDFRLRYVPAADFAPSDLESARRALAAFFPAETRWTFEAVAEIPREASGKTRFCISRLTGGAAGGAYAG